MFEQTVIAGLSLKFILAMATLAVIGIGAVVIASIGIGK
jgi:hypothetical protein